MDKVILTMEMIMAGAQPNGQFRQVQLEALGCLAFPLKSGWRASLIGRSIAKDQYENFLRLKGLKKDPLGPRKLTARGGVAKLDHTMDLGI
jgi:hypothetical protein